MLVFRAEAMRLTITDRIKIEPSVKASEITGIDSITAKNHVPRSSITSPLSEIIKRSNSAMEESEMSAANILIETIVDNTVGARAE